MLAPEFMTHPVVTVSPDTPISDATALLLERGFSALPVVDDKQCLIGIVSEADLLRGRTPADPRAHITPIPEDRSDPPKIVRDVMTEKVLALPENADEADFAEAMIENRFKSIPVTSNGRVLGIVSASDLLRTHLRSDEEIAREVSGRLREYAGGQAPWTVEVDNGIVILRGMVSGPLSRIAVLLAETVPGVTRVRTARSDAAQGMPETPDQPVDVRGVVPRDRRGLRVLSVDDCLEHLRASRVGRLAFVDQGDLVILPVNHGMDHLDVVFRTTWGSKLYAAGQAQRVAFEVDRSDVATETGWSVLVKGTASIVYEDSLIQGFEQLGISSWAEGDEEMYWIRIRPDEITGRQILG